MTPQLVTFNGSGLDPPVISYRAMMHGISAPGLTARPYSAAPLAAIPAPGLAPSRLEPTSYPPQTGAA
ncbi:MAG TPA: hypothetical protein VH678_10490 [Xanthobacteraceae bacterium]